MPRTRGHLGNEDRFFAPKRAVPRASGSLSLEDRAGFPSGCVSFLQQLFTDDRSHWAVISVYKPVFFNRLWNPTG